MTYYLTTVHSAVSSSEYAALSIKNCPILYAIKQFSAKYYLGTEDRATAIKKQTDFRNAFKIPKIIWKA